ncbi:histidine ammonia-lyase [Reichenbachiella sp. 5M10]|uniref:histidine ammonia-lyase n=1 Tax=Reichenbachiella sp. 5M10 TaxID=1889772 RepID=UPI000C14902F|nr:histidine ammonia-lyase [Reichenbachiella sp. 5M10]PIB34928.1 histidine ammonia-lyase [Reichenbachiella sp. 5M10]
MFQYGIDHLTVSKALAIARGKLEARLTSACVTKVEQSYRHVLAISQDEPAVYGINTGFGPLCDTKIDKVETTKLQRNILWSHSVGVGEAIDEELSKLMLICKVHALAQGYSGISVEILERIIWHIEQDVIPVVPAQGSVGASGDLAPLSHLFLPLIGEGEVFYQGQRVKTAELFMSTGMESVSLHAKAGLALINGTQFILAHAVRLVDVLHVDLSHADILGAMMIEGLLGSKAPFEEKLHQLRPYQGNLHVANRIRKFLFESEIVDSHKNCGNVQDPYSLRCIPQVHGSSRTAWLHLKEAVEVELNAVTDNPVIFSQEETISGGNFHGQPLALPIDYACLAAAELGNISDRRSYLSLEGKRDRTPKLLMTETGTNSGFMLVQYTTAALVSENKGQCFPASADSIPTSLGQEDHVSMGSIGARKALRVCENLTKILAGELICAAQAMDFKKPLRSSAVLTHVHDHVRSVIDHAKEDRIFSDDINKATDLLHSRELIQITWDHLGGFSSYDDLFERF